MLHLPGPIHGGFVFLCVLVVSHMEPLCDQGERRAYASACLCVHVCLCALVISHT